jgi:hypothetical protein
MTACPTMFRTPLHREYCAAWPEGRSVPSVLDDFIDRHVGKDRQLTAVGADINLRINIVRRHIRSAPC